MSNLKYKLEALLFSSARSMTLEELSNLTKSSPEEIKEKLDELKKDYAQRDSSIQLIDEGNSVRLNVKSEHIGVIQQIVTETELSKTLMETLAVIAFKYPIKQSDVIKLRTNKGYDHLRQLEEMGYISRQKFGRTNLIKLTPKFFEYFDLPPEKLKDKFQSFEGISKAIKNKEEEIKKIKEDIKKKAEEAGKKKEETEEGPEVDLVDKIGLKEKLEVYEEKEEPKKVEPYEDKLGNLEVVDVPEKEETEESQEQTETFEEQEETEQESEEEKGIPLTQRMGEDVVETVKELIGKEDEQEIEEPQEVQEESSEEKEEPSSPEEIENDVDRRVEELLHPQEKETQEEKTEEPQKQTETQESEEPKDLIESEKEEEEKQQPKKRK